MGLELVTQYTPSNYLGILDSSVLAGSTGDSAEVPTGCHLNGRWFAATAVDFYRDKKLTTFPH
jgi:hypothetical protein